MIVFDASTLILLAKAELLDRFLAASGVEAVMPREVARETCEAKPSFDALLIRRLIDEKKIKVETLRDRTLFEKLRRDLRLGAGEAEAIALAVARKAWIVATDDRCAIGACKLARMPFTTALSLLVRMCEKRVVDKAEALLKLTILERAGRYKKSMIAEARSRLEVA
jgi:predicted nucleic acid-binding protein